MGRSYLFECPKCGYKAKVSGGADQGRDFAVQTVLCRNCRRLHDAVIRIRRAGTAGANWLTANPGVRFAKPEIPPSFEAMLNRLPLPDAASLKWVQFKPRCPVSPGHKIQAWNDPGKCPGCGAFLEKSALAFRIWS